MADLAHRNIWVLKSAEALGTLPAAYVMRQFGRRSGYPLGACLGLLAGLVAASAIVVLNGADIPHFRLALVLLGMGWNFGFIGATAMVSAPLRQRPKGERNSPLMAHRGAPFAGALLTQDCG